MKLDIAFFGSSLVSLYRNDAGTYFRGMLHALAARGHRITFYEPTDAHRRRHLDLEAPPWARVVFYSASEAADLGRVLDESRRVDVTIKASGTGAWDELLEAELASRAGHRIFWDVDPAITLERLFADPHDPLRALVPRFDAILTRGGGARVGTAYALLGARMSVAVHCAVDPRTHYPVPHDELWASDLSLLADRMPDRDPRVEELFFGPARALPASRFLLAGAGWGDLSLPSNVRAVGHATCADHNRLNASARAVLSVTRESMAVDGFAPPAPLFEAAGAGACVITDAWPGIDVFFRPGHEVLVARDGDDVARILRDLNPARSHAVGAAARRHVFEHHTYAQRARLVETLLLRGRPPEAFA